MNGYFHPVRNLAKAVKKARRDSETDRSKPTDRDASVDEMSFVLLLLLEDFRKVGFLVMRLIEKTFELTVVRVAAMCKMRILEVMYRSNEEFRTELDAELAAESPSKIREK